MGNIGYHDIHNLNAFALDIIDITNYIDIID